MSKELEALDELKGILKTVDLEELDELNIIETALKEYEELKSAYTLTKHNGKYYIVIFKEDFDRDCKKLKALEIIKEKERDIGLNFGSVIGNEPKQYTVTLYGITQEEYDLLKEVLL